VGLAVSASVLVLAVSGSTAWATFPGANGRIAYDRTPSGGPYTIRSVLPSGHGDKRLGTGSMPSWSPNGHRLAFIRSVNGQGEVYSMAADGTYAHRLTHTRINEDSPTWSPSGRRIAFDGHSGITVMRSDGSDQRVLTDRGGSPSYSPDGQWIAFVVGRTVKRNASIWVMRRNGTHQHRLLFLGPNGGWIGGYSPDARRISFSRCGAECRYFVADSGGKDVNRLPCPPDYFRGVTAPSYSPNGHRLLGETAAVEVVTVPLHSCSPTIVVHLSPDDAALPDWQPLPIP
jgi:dipeptidyl aminopeptidase/acylaminoacyl peptidase